MWNCHWSDVWWDSDGSEEVLQTSKYMQMEDQGAAVVVGRWAEPCCDKGWNRSVSVIATVMCWTLCARWCVLALFVHLQLGWATSWTVSFKIMKMAALSWCYLTNFYVCQQSSAEVMRWPVCVCLPVCQSMYKTSQKLINGLSWNISAGYALGKWRTDKVLWLIFGYILWLLFHV